MATRFDPRITRALDETGLDWEVKPKKKHQAIVLAGRVVAVVPNGNNVRDFGHGLRNVIATIRREARRIVQ